MESKKGRIPGRVKYWKTALSILAVLSASLALADDFKTINGKEYKNATVGRIEPDGIVIRFSGGMVKIAFTELPKEVQERFDYDPTKAATEQKAFDEQEKAAERERAEQERNAEADLKRSLEEFQVAEQRAAKTYQNARKGSLSGQIFVATKGAGNYKLGAVQVALLARDAINIVLPELRKYADIKIQQLRPSVDAAKANSEQALAGEQAARPGYLHSRYGDDNYRAYQQAREAGKTALRQYSDVVRNVGFYYSGAFYFAYLLSPIHTAESDAEGKFVLEVPQTGDFVIAAQAKRSVGEETERYYWLQPVSLQGQPQLTQNLSNSNLTSATGTSSLVLTKD